MKIAKMETEQFQNGNTCTVQKYSFPSSRLGLVTAEIKGRYPKQGKVLNEVSDETYYVMSGSCTIHHQSGEYFIEEGDVFYLPAGKWWWVEADLLSIVVCTAPPWSAEQYRQLQNN
jgi:mannose-6-phosphate isomerase-like protein (cupin superfamily)